MKLSPATLLFAALIASGAQASAQLVVPIDIYRAVSGVVKLYGPVETLEETALERSSDPGLFDESASATIGPIEALASGGSAQVSEITGALVVAQGSSFVNAESYVTNWDALAMGRSTLSYEFTLTAPARYRLQGEIEAYDDGYGHVYFTAGPDLLVQEEVEGPDDARVFDLSGFLMPGDHRLTVASYGTSYAYPFEFRYGSGEFDLVLELEALASNYCESAPNSVGPGAAIHSSGSHSIAQNDFVLEATGLVPGQFGIFFYGANQTRLPFGDGYRCVEAPIYRLVPAVQADATGFASHALDFTAPPANSGPGMIDPGSTWNFQSWYRDPTGSGGSGFNLSDGLRAIFGV